MKKKLILLSAFSSLVIGANILFSSIGPEFFINAIGNKVTYVHYAKREATSSLDGIREYWVGCGQNIILFEEPSSGTILEGTSYDTSEFLPSDPRWIKYQDDKRTAFYSLKRENYNFSELSFLEGYHALSSLEKTPGINKRYEFYKDDNSPLYSISCLTVSDYIENNSDLASFSTSLSNTTNDGYYVLVNDLISPDAFVKNVNGETNLFKGVFDGRNHKINNLKTSNNGLFGNVEGGIVKNLVFENINYFNLLGDSLISSKIENCSFSLASTPISNEGNALISKEIGDDVIFKDLIFNFGEFTKKNSDGDAFIAGIAKNNLANVGKKPLYENVTVTSLNSLKMYAFNKNSSSFRPDNINYVSVSPFLKNGVSNYKIYYSNEDPLIGKAASLIQDKFKEITGFYLPSYSFGSDQEYAFNDEILVLGSKKSSLNALFSSPSDRSSYALKGIGKAIYLDAITLEGYQLGAIKLLEKLVGYEYLGNEITIFNTPDKNNIDLPFLDISFIPSLGYRKCDWSDYYEAQNVKNDCYQEGYNSGYSKYTHYVMFPSTGDLGAEMYHTSLNILYPGTYKSDHPKWFASKNIFNTKYAMPYTNWQLCYTAHGNTFEYDLMVKEAAKNIQAVVSKESNINLKTIMLGIQDNGNICKCSTCNSKTKEYGSITGTVVKFVNDLRDELYKDISKCNRTSLDIGFFSYLGYEEAPIKNNQATITLKDNVFVLCAPIKANYNYSLRDDINKTTRDLLTAWDKVGRISLWLYDTNFLHYFYPFNSFTASADTISYLSTLNLYMVYFQGQHNVTGPRTAFNAFKKYFQGKLMVDASIEFSNLYETFFNNYYGEGGEKIKIFYNEMVSRLNNIQSKSSFSSLLYDENALLGVSVYQSINHKEFWILEELKHWISLSEEAYSLATSSITKEHILTESLFPRFVIATLFTDQNSWGGSANANWEKDLLDFRRSFKNDATKFNLTITGENTTYSKDLATYYSEWGIA